MGVVAQSQVSTKMAKVALALVSVMMVAAWSAVASMDAPAWCDLANKNIQPCLDYLVGQAAEPSKECCSGVTDLNDHATSAPDRQAVCQCLKDTAGKLNGLVESRLAELPADCGVRLSFPISKDVNCAKINLSMTLHRRGR